MAGNVPEAPAKRDSTYSNDMRALSKMPQNMGPDGAEDADARGPFDLADPQRKSVAPQSDFSQEISQVVNNGQKISPVLQSGFSGAQPAKLSGVSDVINPGTNETAKFDEEESLIAVQEMIQNIN